jgi:PPOX class probable F420-dependent enzyme
MTTRANGPLFRKIDCLRVQVPHLQAGLAFYRDALGQSLIWQTDTAAGLRLPESSAELVIQTEDAGPEVDLMVASVDEAAKRIVAAGGAVTEGPFDIQIGRCVVVRDPWGNRLVLLDASKGLLATDNSGRVIGNVARRKPAVLPSHVEAFVLDQRIARLATVDEHGRPHIVPICFAYTEGVVYSVLDAKPKRVPVERLRRVRNLVANPSVQVIVDTYDEDWTKLRYVQLRGTASLLTEGPQHNAAVGLLREKYEQYREMGIRDEPVIAVHVEDSVWWPA